MGTSIRGLPLFRFRIGRTGPGSFGQPVRYTLATGLTIHRQLHDSEEVVGYIPIRRAYLDQLDIGCRTCGTTYTAAETHDCPGRDMWRQQPDPILTTWRDVAKLAIGVVVIGTLWIGIAFVMAVSA